LVNEKNSSYVVMHTSVERGVKMEISSEKGEFKEGSIYEIDEGLAMNSILI
jgi:hypothetical protein